MDPKWDHTKVDMYDSAGVEIKEMLKRAKNMVTITKRKNSEAEDKGYYDLYSTIKIQKISPDFHSYFKNARRSTCINWKKSDMIEECSQSLGKREFRNSVTEKNKTNSIKNQSFMKLKIGQMIDKLKQRNANKSLQDPQNSLYSEADKLMLYDIPVAIKDSTAFSHKERSELIQLTKARMNKNFKLVSREEQRK